MGSSWSEFYFGLVLASRRWRWRIEIGGGTQDLEDCWNVLPVARTEEASLDISSVGQIILYWKRLTEEGFAGFPENIRRIESFSLE